MPITLGVIEHEGHRVTGYVEKPRLGFSVSMGVYVYEPRVLRLMPSGHFDFPDVVHLLLEGGEPVVSYPFSGNMVRHRDTGRVRTAVEALGLAEDSP